jgi:hypothetical protein
MQALLQFPDRTTTAQLHQFFCAAHWIRTTIPRYAEAVSCLQELLKSWQSEAGSMKQLKRKKLEIGALWTYEHNQCFQELKRIIRNTVSLAHLNPEQ